MNDLISRQAAINKLQNNMAYMQAFGCDRAIMLIREPPSAQPDLQPTCNQLATDCISRQAAIDVAKEELDNGTFYDIPSKIKYLPPAQPESMWIPVKWREPDEKEAEYYTYMADCEMPEDGQEILVTNGKYVWKDVCFYDDGFYLDSGDDWQNITAWMPLPEPYKEVN